MTVGQIVRRFVWSDGRPADHEAIHAAEVSQRLLHQGVLFTLRNWDVRYTTGEPRITAAIYDQAGEP